MPREAQPAPIDNRHESEPGSVDDLLDLEPSITAAHPAPRHWPATASPWATALVDLRLREALAA
jgi:hypothetical protein